MATQVLVADCTLMSAPRSRLLQQRGHEGVIDDQDCTVAVGDFCDGGDVTHAKQRVGGGISRNTMGHVVSEVLVGEGREVADEAGLDAAGGQLDGREAVGAAVGGHSQQQGLAFPLRDAGGGSGGAIPEG